MMIKSIRQTLKDKGKNVLNIYFTAGHPTLESVGPIIRTLDTCGVDIIELGIPYSDPLADGKTIQESSAIALRNGQTIQNIFSQVMHVRQDSQIPILLMGYFNQFLQYGEERFLMEAAAAGIQGLILPDLPMDVYQEKYKFIFEKYGMEISFLITPQTSETRIKQADSLSSAFIYIVSQTAITGNEKAITPTQKAYFERIEALKLHSPQLIGFGIYNRETRMMANPYAHGVIVGSAFIKAIDEEGNLEEKIAGFITSLQ